MLSFLGPDTGCTFFLGGTGRMVKTTASRPFREVVGSIPTAATTPNILHSPAWHPGLLILKKLLAAFGCNGVGTQYRQRHRQYY